jgi:peptidase A4-like protein
MPLNTTFYSSVLLIPIAFAGLVVIANTSPAMSRQLTDRPRRHIPIIVKERRNSVTTSSNWSGYAVTGGRGSVTDVKGSWKVPAIQAPCGPGNQYASFWIGIDGYNSNTVEQIGTDSDCQGGVPTYYAWYEFYPHWSYGITLNSPIFPDDVISAEVKSTTGGIFTVSLTDLTSGQSFSANVKMNNAQRSSAEWIAEAPWSGGVLPLANFGTAQYGANNTKVLGTSSATINGVTGAIGAFGSPTAPSSPVQKITMVTSSGAPKAEPSDLSTDGSSFTITWRSAGP